MTLLPGCPFTPRILSTAMPEAERRYYTRLAVASVAAAIADARAPPPVMDVTLLLPLLDPELDIYDRRFLLRVSWALITGLAEAAPAAAAAPAPAAPAVGASATAAAAAATAAVTTGSSGARGGREGAAHQGGRRGGRPPLGVGTDGHGGSPGVAAAAGAGGRGAERWGERRASAAGGTGAGGEQQNGLHTTGRG